ncbi:MAG: hypothetical protein HC790_08090 [Acaryochloridaceae cyanobacterium CSU_3_4]|nr:hypothetical protein [Acaryochloridaceae cyanobacterium CSU_3_4]
MFSPRSTAHWLKQFFLLIVAAVILCGVVACLPMGATRPFPTARDKFLWPFSSASPWNMPIGSLADYMPAKIKPALRFTADQEYIFRLKARDPYRPLYKYGSWKKRCSGKKRPMGKLPIPDDLIVPDARKGYTPNNTAAFLLPNGRTIVQVGVLARCQKGGPIYGWRFPNVDIYGMGMGGTHGGSGLSAIGGSIRRGELTSDQPIRHTLKVLLWGKKYLYYSKKIPGYRWPADRADKYAPKQYRGTNPQFVQGSLLAIPPQVTVESLKLQTQPGKKLFHALQDYGAYVVDDSAWDAYGFAVEKGVPTEFQEAYGYRFEYFKGSHKNPFHTDIVKLFNALHIVTNNDLRSVGGGGTPRVPLAPPLYPASSKVR